jgi:hypothetical protein
MHSSLREQWCSSDPSLVFDAWMVDSMMDTLETFVGHSRGLVAEVSASLEILREHRSTVVSPFDQQRIRCTIQVTNER